jgi:hypothetical protein
MRDGFGIGMTILTALANLLPALPDEEAYLALFQGIRRVAQDCAGQEPRRDRAPLEGSAASLATLRRWFRQWTEVRHRNAAERTLLTAIASGADLAEIADLMLTAATDRPFADGGHALDFVNKAFECVDLIGEQHAALILPTVVGQLVAARGSDEQNAWRHPIDVVPLMTEAFVALPEAFAEGGRSARAPCRRISGALWPTPRRSGSRASAQRTSSRTGTRRCTSSPMPTPSTSCSGGSSGGTRKAAIPKACGASSRARSRSI